MIAEPPVARVSRVGDDLLVKPLVGSLPEMKTLGSTWDRGSASWKLPAAMVNVASIEDLLAFVEFEDPEEEWHFNERSPIIAVADDRLYDWQIPRVNRLANSDRGIILCASPGLGKTAMAVVAADAVVPDDQVVVVCPSKLTRTWKREIAKWGKGDTSVAIVAGKPDWDEVSAARWVVVSWELFAIHQDWFAGTWPLWVLDESVKAKSRKSTLSMAMRGGTRRRKKDDGTIVVKKWENLRKDIERVWLLSGSPTTRYNDDLWAQLNLIWPRAFRSYWRFAERYCVVEENVWAKTVIGDRRGKDPVADNSDFIEVVNQKDVIDLPEYLPEALDVELTPKQARAYSDMNSEFLADLDSGDVLVADNRMDQLGKLLRIASYFEGESAKHDALMWAIETGLYEPPFLVWTHWREGAEALYDRMNMAGVSTSWVPGGMSDVKTDSLIQGYIAGKTDAIVLSLGVGKFGHTLTNSRTAAYVDKTFNADDYFQSLRRVRRIGLGHRPVLTTIRAPGTADELVELNLESKIAGISRITNASLRELVLGLGR